MRRSRRNAGSGASADDEAGAAGDETRPPPDVRRAQWSAGRAHFLVDGAEHRAPAPIVHLDPYAVAEAQERSRRRSADQRLDGPLLGDARITDASGGRRPARTAVLLIGYRPRADDAAGHELARPGDVRDQRPEVERHVDSGIG